MAPSSPSSRVPALDGLRAVSIGLVLVSHSLIYDSHDSNVIRFGLMCGNTGVSFFFVISGYIITHLLLREETTAGRIHIGRFYARRALRLLPACYVYVLSVYLLATGGLIPTIPTHDFLACVLYIRNLVGRGHETAHLWSLSLEEQFYLFWPAFVVVLPTRWRFSATAGLVALVWVWRFGLVFMDRVSDGSLHIRTDLRIDTILFGCLLALIPSRNCQAGLPDWYSLTVATVGLLLWPFISPKIPYSRAFNAGVMSIGLCALLDWFLRNPNSMASRLLSSIPLVAFGRLSYSLYLWQQLFLGPHNIPLQELRAFPFGLVCAFVAAVMSYFLVELPFLRLKERYTAYTTGRKPGESG